MEINTTHLNEESLFYYSGSGFPSEYGYSQDYEEPNRDFIPVGGADYQQSNPVFKSALNNGTRLCGVPGICKSIASTNCMNVTLNQCKDCSLGASVAFTLFVVILGLAVLIGNTLIIFVSLHLSKRLKATQMDYFKASLAVADLMTGFLLLLVVLPNYAWSINSTFEDIVNQLYILRGSAAVIAGSSLYLVGHTASLYHLIFFGVLRIHALMWPHKYRVQTQKCPVFSIAFAWTLASIVTTIPAWFPQYFQYDYYHVTFLFLPSVVPSGQTDANRGALAMLCILFLVPLVLMTILIVTTAALARSKLHNIRKRTKRSSVTSNFTREEISTFKNIAIMQTGFTITTVPLGVATTLIYAGVLNCGNLSLPYIICFYVSMTNSLVNVLVYSVREQRFRSTVRKMLSKLKTKVSHKDASYATNSTLQHKEAKVPKCSLGRLKEGDSGTATSALTRTTTT